VTETAAAAYIETMNATRLWIGAVVGAAAIGGAVVAWPDSATSAADAVEEGITVTAVGSAEAVPDRAEFAFGVTTHAATADEASSGNAAQMRKLIDALKAAGVRTEDIRTQNVSVSPRYSHDGKPLPGFTAENTVSAKVASARAGAIVDIAVANGATNTSGPTFDVTDRDALYRDALADAVKEARRKAEAIGAAGGVSVGDVTRVVEGAEAGQPVFLEAAARDQGKTTPVEPGQEEVQATLTVTFDVG
jgi:uncharacterized protein YggE